jgi:hypothetical protein
LQAHAPTLQMIKAPINPSLANRKENIPEASIRISSGCALIFFGRAPART